MKKQPNKILRQYRFTEEGDANFQADKQEEADNQMSDNTEGEDMHSENNPEEEVDIELEVVHLEPLMTAR
jgi:hypothetical protein